MVEAVASPKSYAITTDRSRGLVRLELAGFWDPTVAAGLEKHLRAAVESLGLPPNQHRQLCVSRDFKVQSAETLAALQPLMDDPAMRAKRIATVGFGALAKLQGARLNTAVTIANFATEADAVHWLLAEETE